MNLNKKLRDHSSCKKIDGTKTLKHSWKVIAPITIVIMSIIGIGAYVLINATDFSYEFGLEVTTEGVKVNTQIEKR